jgi:hypothetical protein
VTSDFGNKQAKIGRLPADVPARLSLRELADSKGAILSIRRFSTSAADSRVRIARSRPLSERFTQRWRFPPRLLGIIRDCVR